MLQKSCLFLTLFISSFVIAQSVPDIQKYKDRVRLYLDKENALDGYYRIDSSGVKVYSSPAAKEKDSTEFVVRWNELDQFNKIVKVSSAVQLVKAFKNNKGYFPANITNIGSAVNQIAKLPLSGIKIAIDPGHMASAMETAKLEKKFIEMKADSSVGLTKDIGLIEGRLTNATAFMLEGLLKINGATVMRTHHCYNEETSFDMAFAEWLRIRFKSDIDSAFANNDITAEEKEYLLSEKISRKDIFRKFFVNFETKERARKINAFNPDFTVIIHYNVDEKNKEWKSPTKKDFDMAFVGGSFMKEELDKPLSRFEFLRLLLTDDIERSINFSSYFIKSFEKNLNVPTAKETDAEYLKQYCLPTEMPGVYCRNLTLTRMVHGTLVYGETLYKDYINELKLLSKEDIDFNEVFHFKTSSRVQQVANAYYEAIINYVKANK